MPVVRDFILADERSSGLEGGLLRKTQIEEGKKRKKKEGRWGLLRKTGEGSGEKGIFRGQTRRRIWG